MTTFGAESVDSRKSRNPGKTRREGWFYVGKEHEKRCKTVIIDARKHHSGGRDQGLGNTRLCLKTTRNIKNVTGITPFWQKGL